MLESPVVIFGRSSSHFTRVATLFATELGLPWTLEVVPRLLSHDPSDFGGHPALKLPTLLTQGAPVYGAENICRKLTALAGRAGDPTVVLPEQVHDDTARNAQELIWVAMGAQVSMRLFKPGEEPPTPYLLKTQTGLRGALAWLDSHLDDTLAALPTPRQVSVLEVTLLCLVDHLRFFPTFPLDAYPRLLAFADAQGRRESAQRTVFRFDPRPPRDPR